MVEVMYSHTYIHTKVKFKGSPWISANFHQMRKAGLLEFVPVFASHYEGGAVAVEDERSHGWRLRVCVCVCVCV